jgi:hypothetical protein
MTEQQISSVAVKRRLSDYSNINSRGSILAESVLLQGQSAFLTSIMEEGLMLTVNPIQTPRAVFIPPEPSDLPYSQYVFDQNSLTRSLNFEDIYSRVFDEVSKFIVVDEEIKHVITACVMFTYKQDQSSTTPYLYCVGDNDSGKSSVLYLMKHLAYRPLLSDSLPSANIYRFLGVDEEAVGIILEDEAHELHNDLEKLRIYKGGYTKGSKVPRIEQTRYGFKQTFFFTYCFKAFAGERLPLDRGFQRRCIVIKMVEGVPHSNIKDPSPEDLGRLSALRNDIMLWRMQTFNQPLREVQEDFLVNRDKELWKPLLSVVKCSRFYEPLVNVAQKYVSDRQEERSSSLEALLCRIVLQIQARCTVAFDDVWCHLKTLGQSTPNPQEVLLDEHGNVSKKTVGVILYQKFKGKRQRISNKQHYIFDVDTLNKLAVKYGLQGLQGSVEGQVTSNLDRFNESEVGISIDTTGNHEDHADHA